MNLIENFSCLNKETTHECFVYCLMYFVFLIRWFKSLWCFSFGLMIIFCLFLILGSGCLDFDLTFYRKTRSNGIWISTSSRVKEIHLSMKKRKRKKEASNSNSVIIYRACFVSIFYADNNTIEKHSAHEKAGIKLLLFSEINHATVPIYFLVFIPNHPVVPKTSWCQHAWQVFNSLKSMLKLNIEILF